MAENFKLNSAHISISKLRNLNSSYQFNVGSRVFIFIFGVKCIGKHLRTTSVHLVKPREISGTKFNMVKQTRNSFVNRSGCIPTKTRTIAIIALWVCYANKLQRIVWK